MVNTKKSVKSRIKTLIKAGAVAAALAAGGTANAAVGSPMRRGVRSAEPVECAPVTTVEYVEPVVECPPPTTVRCNPKPVRCAPTPQRCRPVRVERPVRQQPARSVNYQHSESSYESYTSTSTYYESTSGGFEQPLFGRGSRSVTPTAAGSFRGTSRAPTMGKTIRGTGSNGCFPSGITGRKAGRSATMGRRNAMPRGGGRMRGPGGRGRGF